MNTLVEDSELKRLRAMAKGSKPFKSSRKWERLAALDLKEFWKLPARERLAVGYYQTARRCAETLRELTAGARRTDGSREQRGRRRVAGKAGQARRRARETGDTSRRCKCIASAMLCFSICKQLTRTDSACGRGLP